MSETTTVVPPELKTDAPPASPVPPKPPLTQRELKLLVVFALIAATMALYQPTLHHFFQIYDDPQYVVENAHVKTGLSWENIRWALTATEAANWHPITWISHMADVQVFGARPMGHHLDSILWHALNVVLLFLLLRTATGYIWRSATVAALFAMCPLNVECVAWIAERKSLISTTFFLLTLFAYGWYARRSKMVGYVATFLLFALGLMAKPMVVTLPVLLLFVDYWPLQRYSLSKPFGLSLLKRLGQLILEKIPLFVLSGFSALLTIYAQRRGGAISSIVNIPMQYRLENAAYSYALYIVKIFWPTHLAPFHPHPLASLQLWAALGAALLLIAITALVWRYRERRWLLTGWAWYIVMLLPVIGIIQVGHQGWAERYAYIPFIGLFLGLVWLAAEMANAVCNHSWWNRAARGARFGLAAVAIVALSAYAWVSCVQIAYWKDSDTLFTHALQVTQRNGVAAGVLGLGSLSSGNLGLAEAEFRTAIRFMPDVPLFYFNLGVVLQRENRLDEALKAYRQSLNLAEAAPPHTNIGWILLQKNDLSGSLVEYSAALRLDHEAPHALNGRAMVEYRRGQFGAAVADFSKSAELSPSADTFTLLGEAYEATGNRKSATDAYERALSLDAGFAEAGSRLAALKSR